MKMKNIQCHSTFLLLLSSILPAFSSSQSTFTYPAGNENFIPRNTYQFKWPIKRVAIIGAGVGGMNAYRELKNDGFDVHIFERDNLPGGTWHYTEHEIPLNAPVPNVPSTIADFEPSLPPQGVEFPYVREYGNRSLCEFDRRAHRAPRPMSYYLTTNTPSPSMKIRGFHWPDGTEWAVPQAKVGRYLRAYATWNSINTNDNSPDISYNARIEIVEKRLNSTSGSQIGWTLTTKKLEETDGGLCRATWNKEDFDAIVVASGRTNAPNMPRIEGLSEWAKRFPNGILHSRQYRRPEVYAGKKVLIVGVAASGSQISREISVYAEKIYQSVRPHRNNTQLPNPSDWVRRIPHNVSLITEIKSFHAPGATIQESDIELADGTTLNGIDYIIFATGYLFSYPFLPDYHDPSLGRTGEAPDGTLQPIVTDGSHIRSLHLDVFYIDDPTLAFLSTNLGLVQIFSWSEYQSLAISMVWLGKAHLPTREEMWRLYREKVKKVGYGKQLSALGIEGAELMRRFFQGWLNAAAVKFGGRQIDGPSPEIAEANAIWVKALFGDPVLTSDVTIPVAEDINLDTPTTIEGTYTSDVVYTDYW